MRDVLNSSEVQTVLSQSRINLVKVVPVRQALSESRK